MRVVPVEHMDEVLREALLLENPETFLREPSRAVDWRVARARRQRRRPADDAGADGAEPAQPEPH